MAGSVVAISSELPPRTSSVFMPRKRSKSRPAEVRAFVVAEKGGKPSGAKGRRKVEARRDQMNEAKPATVGSKGAGLGFPKRAGEAQDITAWVERSIWTERMLKRLATSQEQTKAWFEKQGLFSLKTAQAQWLQSLAGNH